jgi:hypothetical protein
MFEPVIFTISCHLLGPFRVTCASSLHPAEHFMEPRGGKARISGPEALQMTKVPCSVQFLLALGFILLTSGCSVNVNKGTDGHDKNVKIDTPLGNIHVTKNDNAAQSAGISVYPGATLRPDKEGDKGADVQLGFGPWQLRVKVANYQTSDDQDRVISFYRKALGSDGEVIECRGDRPVGSPTRTKAGLTCSDEVNTQGVHTGKNELILKSGSKRRQRIVAFEHENSQSSAGPTQFTLVALDLPKDTSDARESD